MRSSSHLRAVCLLVLASGAPAIAQSTAGAATDTATPAAVEARKTIEVPKTVEAPKTIPFLRESHPVTSEQRRKAEDAYLAGAHDLDRNRPGEAMADFTLAAKLDPNNTEYALALSVAREHRLTQLVQQAGNQRLLGHDAAADALLQQARPLDPDNPILMQHLISSLGTPLADPYEMPKGPRLLGAVQLIPKPVRQSFHTRTNAQSLLRSLAESYGIAVTFDPSVTSTDVRLDLENMTYDEAMPIALMMSHNFAVPLTPTSVYIARDTSENRQNMEPQLLETFNFPAQTRANLNEISTLLKNVFEVKQVTVVPSEDALIVRAPEATLKAIRLTLADMIDDDGEVMIDMQIYAIDESRMRNLGLTLPQSFGAYNLASSAQSAITANQSAINQAVSSGLLTLNGSATQNEFTELLFLLGAGLLQNSPLTNTVALFGGGITTTGLFIGGTSFNLGYNSSDSRALDDIQIRAGDRQDAVFRIGTRYPIQTAVYSSSVPSLPSSLAGATVNGVSVQSLLNQFSGAANSIPQFQYEDLGLTVKVTPTVQKSGMVSLKLSLKIEALAGGSVNNIPILASRTLDDQGINIPDGSTVVLASNMTASETNAVTGTPGLSELPGFQSVPNQNKDVDTDRLVILLTPHVVRKRSDITVGPRVAFTIPPVGSSN